jgi:hypothetical protein
MAIVDLWLNSRNLIEDKHIQQIIAISGSGKLLDGSSTSTEFRHFLDQIPSRVLARYADECLKDSFKDSGLALQDIINQVGKRLGFNVNYGRYRGSQSAIGADGVWRFPEGHSIIVEIKTTDAYRINLSTIAGYSKELLQSGQIQQDSSSVLIVVGREDTGDLEAQIRGSRYAWTMRLISVDALLRLMALKESVEDPQTVQRIYDILIPREFTKLDEIIDVLFSTAEEVKQDEIADEEQNTSETTRKPKFIPSDFHASVMDRVQNHLSWNLLKRSRAAYSTPAGDKAVICSVSKEYQKPGQIGYWFSYHPHQREFFRKAGQGYLMLGCGSESNVLAIPFEDLESWLEGMNVTEKPNRSYWHIHIHREDNRLVLHRKKEWARIDLTKYLIP